MSLNSKNILTVSNCDSSSIISTLNRYGLHLKTIPKGDSIPGSYWGDSEAGVIGNIIYVRPDTPIHSLFHETCHYICMDEARRKVIDTDAEGDYDEENGVCYLQIMLAASIPEMGKKRMMQDMDTWGYTFRLGSAKAWFEQDAEEALQWLQQYGVLDKQGKPSYQLRR